MKSKKLLNLLHTRSDRSDSESVVQLANTSIADNDVVGLRELATTRGLASKSVRKRAWPYLLDAKPTGIYGTGPDATAYREHANTSHKDNAVVRADIDRSLWKFSDGWTDEERDIERERLKNMINACVEGNDQGVFYYQGLHDVASVLLLVCGEGAAHGMLHRLVRCHLRDCTRATMDPALRTLRLLYPILKRADKELYKLLTRLATVEPALEMPYFALSWYMTWFAHDVDSLEDISRLFDLFMSSHPLMPLYVAAEVLAGARKEILKRGSDPELLYSFLNRLSITGPGRPTVDDLAKRAVALIKSVPPHELTAGKLKRDLLASSAVPFAYLDKDGRWQIPPVAEPPASSIIASHSLDDDRDRRRNSGYRRGRPDRPDVGLGPRVAVGTAAVIIAGVFTAASSLLTTN